MDDKKNIVVLTGAGISAESGIPTYRDKDGLWEKYDFMELASPQGWAKDYKLVLEFYNVRRQKVREALPNKAHLALVELEKFYRTVIVTQNVDNLHEKAGSKNILHLHGEIMKSRSTLDENIVYDLGDNDIQPGDTCELGSQLRPDVVWFGEAVPMLEDAIRITEKADIFIVIGTSLEVYPAATLINYVPEHARKIIIDKKIPSLGYSQDIELIQQPATIGVPEIVNKLNNIYNAKQTDQSMET
jgi:NAD-dependent deacetylase